MGQAVSGIGAWSSWQGLLLAAVAILTFSCLPALWTRFLSWCRRAQPRPERVQFEDIDGKSTPESLAAYESRVRAVKVATAIISVLGVGLAVLSQVLQINKGQREWEDASSPNVVLWVLALVHSGLVVWAPRKDLYMSGLAAGCVSLAIAALHFYNALSIEALRDSINPLNLGLQLGQAAFASLLAAACLAIPHRPALFDDSGRWINKQYTGSVIDWMAFLYAEPAIATAKLKVDLDVVDIGQTVHQHKAMTRLEDGHRAGLGNGDVPLWRGIAWVYRKYLIIQFFYAVGISWVINMAPGVAILGILRAFETEAGEEDRRMVWARIFVFFLAMEFGPVYSHICWQWGWASYVAPLRSQLAALVLDKSLRIKDIKETSEAKDSTDGKKPAISANTANLIGIDLSKLANALQFMDELPSGLATICFSAWYLTGMLGWRPFFAGVAMTIFVLGLGGYVMSRYVRAQRSLMSARDAKLAVVSEALAGIRQIKFTAAERRWEDKIERAREEEMRWVWEIFAAQIMLITSAFAAPVLLTAACYAAHGYYMGGPPSASVTFASAVLFRGLNTALANFPDVVRGIFDVYVSVNRLDAFLRRPEVADQRDRHADQIVFSDASVAWPAHPNTSEAERFLVRRIDATFPRGKLSLVSGKTGSGKSLILAAVLGEAELMAGKLGVPGTPTTAERDDPRGLVRPEDWVLANAKAYVPQLPWIENASVLSNITFGSPFDRVRFDAVVDACALRHDINLLHDGEDTEIGVNGINLSGGQKWRLMLARAVYSRAGILVLDDVFSAVDAHVGKHILEKCLGGELCQGRTILLATHHVSLCIQQASYVIGLGGGTVRHVGAITDENRSAMLAQLMELEETAVVAHHNQSSSSSSSSSTNNDNKPIVTPPQPETEATTDPSPKTIPPRKFIKDETRARGAVANRVYAAYFRDSGGLWFCLAALALFGGVQALDVYRAWWLKIWTSSTASSSPDSHSLGYYVGVYLALVGFMIIIVTLRTWYVLSSTLRASRAFFTRFNSAMLRAPIRWLDTTPVGRILNRYTTDFSALDTELAPYLVDSVYHMAMALALLVASIITTPWIVLVVVLMIVPVAKFAASFLSLTRPARRLNATSLSCVMQTFHAALEGVATLRAFGRTDEYMAKACAQIDNWAAGTIYTTLGFRWIGVRVDAVTGLICTAARARTSTAC